MPLLLLKHLKLWDFSGFSGRLLRDLITILTNGKKRAERQKVWLLDFKFSQPGRNIRSQPEFVEIGACPSPGKLMAQQIQDLVTKNVIQTSTLHIFLKTGNVVNKPGEKDVMSVKRWYFIWNQLTEMVPFFLDVLSVNLWEKRNVYREQEPQNRETSWFGNLALRIWINIGWIEIIQRLFERKPIRMPLLERPMIWAYQTGHLRVKIHLGLGSGRKRLMC